MAQVFTRKTAKGSSNYASASDEETAQRTACELAQSLQQSFADRDRLYKDITATLFQEFPVEIPDAYKLTAIQVKAPLALHIVEHVTSALTVNDAKTGFKPMGFGDVYEENSTRRERFFDASWERQQQEARRRLLRLFLWSLVAKGEGVLKTAERATSAWNTYTDAGDKYLEDLLSEGMDQQAQDLAYDHYTEQLKLALPYPIATTDVPPETFYYEKNENGFTCQMEIKDVPYNEALQRFGTGLDSSGMVIDPQTWSGYDPRAASLARAEWQRMMRSNGQQTIRVIEAWDEQVQVIVLQGPGQTGRNLSSSRGGTLCRTTRHTYGQPGLGTLRGPYFHALGITTDSRLPEHAGLGILFGYLPLFQLINSLLTVQANAAFLTGFPSWKETQPPNAIPGLPNAPYGVDGRERTAERIEPGKLYPWDVAPIDQPRSGVDAEKLIGNIQNIIQQALPSVTTGQAGADTSGYAMNQAAYLARLAWDPIVSNAETALGERTGFESWLIENRISEKVYAWGETPGKKGSKRGGGGNATKGTWLSVGPDDLNGVHRYTVTLAPSTPSNDIIETRAIGEKLQLKLITWEDAITDAGSNPDEVEKSHLLHDLKMSPEVQQMLKDQVFQRVATIQTKRLNAPGNPSMAEMAGMAGPGGGAMQGPGGPVGPPSGPPTGVPGTPGMPPSGALGGMPGNPVPGPGSGLPLAPPGPGGAPGIPSGMPQAVPNPPMNAV